MIDVMSQRRVSQFTWLMRCLLVALAPSAGVGCMAASSEISSLEQESRPAPVVDARRSLAITEQPILARFSLERVLDQIIRTSGVSGVTRLDLFRQWWDTQNPRPGLGRGPHCDDQSSDDQSALNGYPYTCRSGPDGEGSQIGCDPFGDPTGPCAYIPIGLFMRFDAAPEDGSNCGEYRIVYARKAATPDAMLHVIFEGIVPNPDPQHRLAACKPVAQFWADLSRADSMADRRAAIEGFFFDGIAGFEPVVHPDHFGKIGGRVRTSQGGGNTLRFYQFRLVNQCRDGNCRLLMMPDGLENFTHGILFDGNNTSDRARRFRDEFVKQAASLSLRDVNLYSMSIPREFLMHESDPGTSPPAFIYDGPFTRSVTTPDGKDFSDRIAAELARAGSTLTPVQVINRAETRGCVGCHGLSGSVGEGVNFPSGMDNANHVSDLAKSMVDGEGGPGTRFGISPAVRDVFVPHRMEILHDFLLSGKPPVHSN